MSSFIDRNPEQMMRYANDAKTVIGEMTLIIRKVEGVLDAYEKDLDAPTRKQIAELHRCCNEYFKEIEVYQNIADSIYRTGKRLNDVRAGGYR